MADAEIGERRSPSGGAGRSSRVARRTSCFRRARHGHGSGLARAALARPRVPADVTGLGVRGRAEPRRRTLVLPPRRRVGRHGGLAPAVHGHRRRGSRPGGPARHRVGTLGRRRHGAGAGPRRRPARLAVRSARCAGDDRVRDEPDPRASGDGDPPTDALRRTGRGRRGGRGRRRAPPIRGRSPGGGCSRRSRC